MHSSYRSGGRLVKVGRKTGKCAHILCLVIALVLLAQKLVKEFTMDALKKRMATLREEKERALTDLETVKEKLRETERETAAVRYA